MRRLSAERGSVTIIVALTLTTLLGAAAVVIDLGAATAEHRALQTGADAAAIAVAQGCVEALVDPTMPACATEAPTIAQTYFDANSTSAVDVDHTIEPVGADRFGRIAVDGTVAQQLIFAGMIESVPGPLDVAAAAAARWGPVTETNDAFPLAVCDGALPGPGTGEHVLVVDPAATTPPAECHAAPHEDPFGWLPPNDPIACTTAVTLLPTPTSLAVGPVDPPPSAGDCDDRVDELFDAIAAVGSSVEDRTRILPVYDAAAGVAGARPSYSLIAFEFTGARIGVREAHQGLTEACAAGLHCIRGEVRYYSSPVDGPIADATTAVLPGIDDVTVLDVRLVE